MVPTVLATLILGCVLMAIPAGAQEGDPDVGQNAENAIARLAKRVADRILPGFKGTEIGFPKPAPDQPAPITRDPDEDEPVEADEPAEPEEAQEARRVERFGSLDESISGCCDWVDEDMIDGVTLTPAEKDLVKRVVRMVGAECKRQYSGNSGQEQMVGFTEQLNSAGGRLRFLTAVWNYLSRSSLGAWLLNYFGSIYEWLFY